ncbi:MAG: amidohydrolase family protein, partial [Longimicrobiales bacterium]
MHRPAGGRAIAAALLVVFAATPAGAQAQSAPIVVRADRMLDVEAGRIVSDAVVTVHAGRIVGVGEAAAPKGAEVVELGDMTLLPGLIDAHVHITGSIEPGWQYRSVTETAADAALRGAQNARTTLLAGFTTVRDLGAPGFSSVALAHAIDAGRVPGPRIVAAGHSIGITGGHCDETGWAPGVLELGPKQGVA